MDISFIITGKAGKKGNEQWCETIEEDFSTRIYTHSKREASEASRLEIELKENNGVYCSDYTFLKVKNVAQVKSPEDETRGEKHGRTGSFFGMTVRLTGCYFIDITKLYSLFEDVFKNRIMGIILTNENTEGYLTYLIDKLSDGENQFRLAESDIKSQIDSIDTQRFPDDFSLPQQAGESRIVQFNVEDTKHESFIPTLLNKTVVNVSREYLTIAEIEEQRSRAEQDKRKKEEELFQIKSSVLSPVEPSKKENNINQTNIPYCGTISPQKKNQSVESAISDELQDTEKNDIARHFLFLVSLLQETCQILSYILTIQKNDKKQNSDNHIKEQKEKIEIVIGKIEKEKKELEKQINIHQTPSALLNNKGKTLLGLFNGGRYKLFIPIAVIIIIGLGLILLMKHNGGDEEKYVSDTIHDTIVVKETITVNNNEACVSGFENDKKSYRIDNTDAWLRQELGKDRHTVIKNGSMFTGIRDTIYKGEKYIYGIDADGNEGYTKKSNLKDE